MAHTPFRFGVNLVTSGSRADWRDRCRRAEDLGFDVIAVPDHIGMPAPFPALVSAAEATTRPRLGVFVVNAGFYRPALLARDVAGTDALVDGRLELGLGAGYVKDEFDAAGLPWPSARERVDHLERTVVELRALLGSPDHAPAPVQNPVPFLIAGNGDRVLRIAAEHADVIAFSGATSGDTPGTLRLVSPAALAERVRLATEAAGDRQVELNLLVQAVGLGGEADAVRERFAIHLPADELADAPTVLAGSESEIAETLLRNRETYGFTYLTVLEPAMEAFARVFAKLR